MKAFLIFTILIIFFGCNKNHSNSTQAQTKDEISSNTPSKENLNKNKTQNSSENILPVQKWSPKKNPEWTAGNFKGLQLGKFTVKDVKRIFGEPKEISHPEDEYDNSIESRLLYSYDNEPQIIIVKKSGIVIEIWGGDFSTFKEAKEKYGNDFYEIEFTKKGCVFKDYKEKENPIYPLNIAYPQYGFYFYVTKGDYANVYYVAKCGE